MKFAKFLTSNRLQVADRHVWFGPHKVILLCHIRRDDLDFRLALTIAWVSACQELLAMFCYRWDAAGCHCSWWQVNVDVTPVLDFDCTWSDWVRPIYEWPLCMCLYGVAIRSSVPHAVTQVNLSNRWLNHECQVLCNRKMSWNCEIGAWERKNNIQFTVDWLLQRWTTIYE